MAGVVCAGGQAWNDCGSACNKTCATPDPICVEVCTPRCECPDWAPIWSEALGICVEAETCECQNPHMVWMP